MICRFIVILSTASTPILNPLLRKLVTQDLFVDAAILRHRKVTVDAQAQILRTSGVETHLKSVPTFV